MIRSTTYPLVGGLVAVALLAGCTPSTTTAADTPTTGPSTAPISAKGSEYVEPLPRDQYPAEVDGWKLGFALAVPVYDKPDERIVIAIRSRAIPASEVFEGVDANHQELRPNVWCYTAPDGPSKGQHNCNTNGTSGRQWGTIDMFETLTLDELADWTAKFAPQIP